MSSEAEIDQDGPNSNDEGSFAEFESLVHETLSLVDLKINDFLSEITSMQKLIFVPSYPLGI